MVHFFRSLVFPPLFASSFLSYSRLLSAGRGDRVASGAFEPLRKLGPWVGFAFHGAASPLESIFRRPTHPPPAFALSPFLRRSTCLPTRSVLPPRRRASSIP